jgi:hypothetical protein
MKESSGGGEFKYDIFLLFLLYRGLNSEPIP